MAKTFFDERWGAWIVNLRQTMYKLQTALCQKGVYININQYQHYSKKNRKDGDEIRVARKARV